jgi:hypothetical protein
MAIPSWSSIAGARNAGALAMRNSETRRDADAH